MHARDGAGEQQRVGHVVAVTEVGQRDAGEGSLVLADRLQVSERLAGMGVVGQRIDHRHRRRCGKCGDPVLAKGADHDGVDVTRQHLRGVFDRLAATELRGAGVEDDGMAAELGDADLEGQPGPGRGLLEHNRHGARASQRPRREAILLHPVGLVEDRRLLGGGHVVVDQEVADHCCSEAAIDGPPVTSATRASSCATLNGLVNTEASPSCWEIAGTASSLPVTTITGTLASAGSPLSSSMTRTPPRSGIIRSSKISDGFCRLALTSPASPSEAVATSYPSADSSVCSSPRTLGSSSTTRTWGTSLVTRST